MNSNKQLGYRLPAESVPVRADEYPVGPALANMRQVSPAEMPCLCGMLLGRSGSAGKYY